MSSKTKIEKFVCRMHGLSGLGIVLMPKNSMHQFKTICRLCGDRHTGWCNEQQAKRLMAEYENYLDASEQAGGSSDTGTKEQFAPPLVPTVKPVLPPSKRGVFIGSTSSTPDDADE